MSWVDGDEELTVATVYGKLPNCDYHKQVYGDPTVTAQYDAMVPSLGMFGYLCEYCFQKHGPGRLGTGIGQRLVVAR